MRSGPARGADGGDQDQQGDGEDAGAVPVGGVQGAVEPDQGVGGGADVRAGHQEVDHRVQGSGDAHAGQDETVAGSVAAAASAAPDPPREIA